MSDTIRLLRSIGHPTGDGEFSGCNPVESSRLLEVARRNKVGALYLSRLDDSGRLDALDAEVASGRRAFEGLVQTTRTVCDVLDDRGLRFAVVKTPTAFPADFSDVDLLIERPGLSEAVAAVEGAGFEPFENELDAILEDTVPDYRDPETGALVDLQDAFTTRELVYLSGDLVLAHSGRRERAGRSVVAPEPAAEIPLLAVHAVTEQLLTLRDVYHLYWLFDRLDWRGLETYNRIVREAGLQGAMQEVLPVVVRLTREAFDVVPSQLIAASARFDAGPALDGLAESGWQMPYRYRTGALVRTFGWKLRDPTFRRSMLPQARELTNPRVVRHNVRTLLERQRRDTY